MKNRISDQAYDSQVPTPQWTVSNKLIELAEINIDAKLVEASISGETEIFLDLRFGLGSIGIGGQEIEIGFKCAELYLDLDGVEITPGSRFGDQRVDAVAMHSLKESVKASSSNAASTKGGFDLDPTKFLASASHEESRSVAQESNFEKDHIKKEYRISARPNRLWLLEGPSGGPLVNTYFAGDLLCKIRPLANSNRRAAKIVLLARKKDVHFSLQKKIGIVKGEFSGARSLNGC
ncbi:hypothetical protein [Mesorhizobium sp. ES1-3]|uniref:hypothetical protein n=1 Tax=Mesorhizobium sp. ES1-3 TaxID=2876628 RepID=UPI001CCCE065|nr:hypothetical protein [Mesorhizobium sp. ES1-3]MBZ9673999.1 hypothetical protein [Mesorhizobium sp. ES1-3]